MFLLSPMSLSLNANMFFLLAAASLAVAACRLGEKGRGRSLATWFAGRMRLGLASLVRPSSQSILVLGIAGAVGFMIARQVKPKLFQALGQVSGKLICGVSLAVVSGVLICVGPALRHNAALGAGWTLSTNNELNCLLGNNPFTPHYKPGTWEKSRTFR